MERQTILDTPGASLWYYPKEKIVHHQIHRYVCGPELRELLTRGGEVLKKNGARKWLSDDRKNGPLSKEDGQWADQIWLPPVVAAGWNTWAMVHPELVIGQMNVKQFTDGFAKKGLTVKVFDDPAKAMAWLAGL